MKKCLKILVVSLQSELASFGKDQEVVPHFFEYFI